MHAKSEVLDRARAPIDQAISGHVEGFIGVLALSSNSPLECTSSIFVLGLRRAFHRIVFGV